MRTSAARQTTAILIFVLTACAARPPSAQAFTLISMAVHPATDVDHPALAGRVDPAPDDSPFYVDTIWGVPCKIHVWVRDDDLFMAMRVEPSWLTADDKGPREIDATLEFVGNHSEKAHSSTEWTDQFALCDSKRRSWEPRVGDSNDRDWLIHIKKDWIAQIIMEKSAAPSNPEDIIVSY